MTYIGVVAIIIGAFMIWREYSLFLEKELSACRAFLRAISDYRDKVKCYLDSPRGWALGYRDELLEECGFLQYLRDGEDMDEAYRSVKDSLCLSEAADEIIGSCFSRLGEGYLDTELEAIEIAIKKLEKEESVAADEVTRKRRAVGAALGAFASGTVILII